MATSTTRLLRLTHQLIHHTPQFSHPNLQQACDPFGAGLRLGLLPHGRQFADAPEPLISPVAKQTAPQTRPDAAALAERNKGPWVSVQDKASGAAYWWNESAGVTTPVGAPRPDAWVAVRDEKSGDSYWWNQQSGDTTAVGEPMPGPEGRLVVAGQQQMQQTQGNVSAVQLLGNSLAVGFGVGLVFALIRMVF